MYYNIKMIKKIRESLNRLEDKIRRKLSRYPIVYAFIVGTGIVLFWRGIWHTADDVTLGGITSLIIGTVVLILVGGFVSEFIGKQLIISGIVGEKKLTEKEGGEIKEEKSEIETEETQLRNLQNTLNRVEKKMTELETEIEQEKK